MLFSPTRAEIQAIARNYLDDVNVGKTWTNWQVNRGINLALIQLQKRICALDKGFFEQVTSLGLTADTAKYSLPHDIMMIKDVELVLNGQVCRLQRIYTSQIPRTGAERGTPRYYYIHGDRQIGFYPVPSTSIAPVAADSGPIRITYIERVPRFVELDHPVHFETYTEDGTNTGKYLTLDIAHTVHQGPPISWDWDTEVNLDNLPLRYYKLITQFVRRDERKSRYSAPEAIGMPWVSGYSTLLGDPLTNTSILNITKWPKGNRNDSQWPEGATHLDIWIYAAGNPTHPVISPTAVGTWLDVAFLGNILPEDDWADGAITFNQLGGATEPTTVNATNRGIWDGSTVINDVPDGVGQQWSTDTYNERWIQQIPPTPYLNEQFWPPHYEGGVYVDNPPTGTGIHHDLNLAKGDADIVHPDYYSEHIEVAGMLAAIKVLAKHGKMNSVLNRHVRDEIKDMLEMYGSRDSAKRTLNIHNPDPTNTPVGRPLHTGLRD